MRILGIDYGSKRLGLSLSDPTKTIASSYKTIRRKDLKADILQIVEAIKEKEIETVVVGMPIGLSGNRGKSASEAEEFISEIRKNVNVPVEEWDERFTTTISEQVLIESDMSRRKRKRVIDGMAAGIMLENYLDAKKK